MLQKAKEFHDGSGLVFPSVRSKVLSDSTLSKMLRDLKIQAVPHGFRSSFRNWCAETNVDREIAEAALAHTIKNATEAAYLRTDILDLRRELMGTWGGLPERCIALICIIELWNRKSLKSKKY